MASAQLTFPLIPRRRLIGLSFGAMHSARRGMGSDIAGSRPYSPGDDIDTIDWNASARLSAARASDDFIVREWFAEEAPRVVIICDRRRAMALYPAWLPWLSKPQAMRQAVELIAESALHARGLAGYLDYADAEHPDPGRRDPEPYWQPPRSQASSWSIRERLDHDAFHAPRDNLTRALEHLQEAPNRVPPGSFVFVCSDFIVSPERDLWLRAAERRWDLVPVVIQDPTWEQSFPDVSSLVVPLADPDTGKVRHVRLTRAEALARRAENERRLSRTLADFVALAVEPILIGTSAREPILQAFIAWAEGRAYRWWHPW
ncbi:MAG: DUF58 domain-containing protein [Actinomycetota bacterium]|nr:DUF58 domain-containing protein [Actinomycetota bacterium]